MAETGRHPFEGRLGQWPDQRMAPILVKRVQEQLKYLPSQVEMDLAHTVMLAEQEIISESEAKQILTVLHDLGENGPGSLSVNVREAPVRSSLYWYVEATLIDRLGEQVGGKMHTGRSHNDIMPTVSRLTARRHLMGVLDALTALQAALVSTAKPHVRTIMPGYTALQHGQPWTLGHYMVGWFSAFARDFSRLRNAYENTNQSPLGASALAGTSWALDRRRTAELLGFSRVLVNSRDAGFATRDYVAEILAAVAIMMSNLSSLCSDLYLWSSFEYSMINIANGFCGTSSFMPQKKNAWAVDWPRGAAGEVIGHFTSCLAALRGASSTDGSFQDYPEQPLEDAFDTATTYLPLLAGVIETLQADKDLMLSRASANWTTASNLADTIVRRCGLSFRVAHGVVGRVVRAATEAGTAPLDLTAGAVEAAGAELGHSLTGLTDEDVRTALDPVAFVESRVTLGSVRPSEVLVMIADAEGLLAFQREWVAAEKRRLEEAHNMLHKEVTQRIRQT